MSEGPLFSCARLSEASQMRVCVVCVCVCSCVCVCERERERERERESRDGFSVVISQTHWLVSQERLSPRAGTSVFIEYTVLISGEQWF